jgi:hypothetical protein
VLASLIREQWQLYLSLGALVGGGVNLLAYTGQSLYLTRWFVRRRGLALSIAFSGVGVGSVAILAVNLDCQFWVANGLLVAGAPDACGTGTAQFAAQRQASRPRSRTRW